MRPAKWVQFVFTLWIAVITYRYVNVVVRSLRSPFNLGSDLEWFTIWLGLSVVMIVAAVFLRRAVPLVFAVLSAACLAALILSGTLPGAIVASLIFLLGHVWGKRILRFFDVEAASIAITIPLGLIIPALSGFVLGIFHLLTPLFLTIALLVPLLIRSRARTTARNARPIRQSLSGRDYATTFPFLLIAPVVFLNLTWAVAPEIQFDASNYHLSVAQVYLRNSGFIDLPNSFHSYFYHFVEMLFTIALAFNGIAAAKLLSFGFSLIAALAVFSLGKLLFDERTGIWSAAFFYTTPAVSWLAGTAYIDNVVAAFLAATVIAFVRWQSSTDKTGWLYVSALLGGAAVAAKLNAAFALPVMAAIAAWELRRQPRTLAICALLVIAVALPWYAMTYAWTGNPVFPMLNGIFKSPLAEPENRVMNASQFGLGVTPGALLRLPFRLILETTQFGEVWPRGGAGITLLFALPFGAALLGKRKGGRVWPLFLICLAWFLLWAVSFQYARYYVHILPIICVLGTATAFQFSEQRWSGAITRICLAIALVLQFPGTSIEFWNIEERFPTAVAFGREGREQFLIRGLDDYAGADHLNKIAKPDERVLGLEVEDARLYLTAPLETLPDTTRSSTLIAAASMSGQGLLQTLRQSGFAYLFARRTALKDVPDWYPYFKPEFLGSFARLEFKDDHVVVYRLNEN